MPRTVGPQGRFRSEQLFPGVVCESLYPGGKDGPNRECLSDLPGGQTWSDAFVLGDRTDEFQLLVPDIRLPANQYWPLHWHDCWTVVLILEGQCCIGDWWMQPGDVFITVPSLEYGPLIAGPKGCRLFEIFARADLAPGGYSPEYRDHPTLQSTNAVFFDRSELNRRNAGRQILSCDNVDGIWKTRLTPDAVIDLGQAGDPERGLMRHLDLKAGDDLPARRVNEWYAVIVLGGSLQLGARSLREDDYLIARPDSRIEAMTAGPNGAQLLELARTARGSSAQALA